MQITVIRQKTASVQVSMLFNKPKLSHPPAAAAAASVYDLGKTLSKQLQQQPVDFSLNKADQ